MQESYRKETCPPVKYHFPLFVMKCGGGGGGVKHRMADDKEEVT